MGKQNEIPSSISSKLEQIKLYMGMNSVTAFVGAGFSKNAIIPDNVSVKTWEELREVFLEKLYPNNEEEKRRDSNDVVRLASLVEAEFGHNELDSILEDALPDRLIRPGELHRLLVQLPWKDILTTNYDTLIERAATQLVNGFKLVTNKETLLYHPSPRIIKLHGSFPNIRPYVMTHEDYRRYPIERPEMVNTAKQCFLEGLVCLIGFSGTDPNFRAWLGWLNDVIGKQRLCPTYLITYCEGFHDAEKALMSQMGIDIINLAEVKGINGFHSAYKFFLDYLKERPSEWRGNVNLDNLKGKDLDDEEFKESLQGKINEMKTIRETYPGWLLLPKRYETDFKDTNEDVSDFEFYYKRVKDESTKLRFLYEINWRLSIAVVPKNLDWFVDAIKTFLEQMGNMCEEDQKMMADLAISLLEIIRLNNHGGYFLQLCNRLINSNGYISKRHIRYQQALYWLASYNQKELKTVLAEWEEDLGDYENCLQKANVLCYIGETLEAYRLLSSCKDTIRMSLLNNMEDIYAKSCLSYIIETMSWFKKDKNEDVDKMSDYAIGESFEEITERLCAKAYEYKPVQRFSFKHLFMIGHYNNSWHFGSSGFVPDYLYPYKWWALKEKIGISMFQINTNFTKYCIEKMFEFSPRQAWNMMMLSASNKVIEDVLGREQLNAITEDEANGYFDTYISLFESKDANNSRRVQNKILNTLPIVLTRLCTKVSQDRVLRFAKAALTWNPIFVKDHLRCIYDCLDNQNLKVILVLLLTEKNLKSAYGNNGYPIPNRFMLDFIISERLKDRIVEGLNSNKHEDVLQAVCVMELVWRRTDLPNDYRNEIAQAVIKMRNGENAIPEAKYTYTYIEPEKKEIESFQSRQNKDVRTFCETTFRFVNSSEVFSQWLILLDTIRITKKYLSEEQKKEVILHCCEQIDLNRDGFEKNDKDDIMGGLRHFTKPVINSYQYLFLNLDMNTLKDDEHLRITEQIDWLISVGYHCLPMKVKASINKNMLNDEILESVKVCILSKKQDVQSEGVNAFLVLKDNEVDISKILNPILINLNLIDNSAYKNLLILFLNLILRGYDEDGFNQRVLSFLFSIHSNYRNYGMDISSLVDMQFYANYVAGALSIKTNFDNIPVFTKEDVGFNDVVSGFDFGKEKAPNFMNE